MLVTMAAGLLAPYTLLAVAGWLLLAPLLLLTRPVERLTVRATCRFRTPAGRDDDWLAWLRSSTEARCGVPAGRLDWYVRSSPQPNAFAVGRRSIAVSTGFLSLLSVDRLTPDQAVAVAVHEIGHHATGGPRYGLVVGWLSWPWQTVYRAAIRLGHRLPHPGVGNLLIPVVITVAIIKVVRDGGPPQQILPVLVTLVAIALAVLVCPVGDAALSRVGEHAADAYTARAGLGPDLADALHRVAPCRSMSLLERSVRSHPATDVRHRRLARLAPHQPQADRRHAGVSIPRYRHPSGPASPCCAVSSSTGGKPEDRPAP